MGLDEDQANQKMYNLLEENALASASSSS
jgi:hypothetical protein